MDFYDKVKSFITYYKVNLLLGGLLLIIIILSNLGIYFYLTNQIESSKNTEAIYVEDTVSDEDIAEEKEIYKVDIKGAVVNPDVYELEKGSRVIDVIKVAGGLTEFADTRVNNLSKNITDEMVIVIYTKEEVETFTEVKEKEIQENKECISYNENINNDSCIDSPSEDISSSEIDTKLSLNSASLDLLMTLPGIGESKAKNIIAYREENGGFKSIEDIKNISGIGESVFEKIKDYITI